MNVVEAVAAVEVMGFDQRDNVVGLAIRINHFYQGFTDEVFDPLHCELAVVEPYLDLVDQAVQVQSHPNRVQVAPKQLVNRPQDVLGCKYQVISLAWREDLNQVEEQKYLELHEAEVGLDMRNYGVEQVVLLLEIHYGVFERDEHVEGGLVPVLHHREREQQLNELVSVFVGKVVLLQDLGRVVLYVPDCHPDELVLKDDLHDVFPVSHLLEFDQRLEDNLLDVQAQPVVLNPHFKKIFYDIGDPEIVVSERESRVGLLQHFDGLSGFNLLLDINQLFHLKLRLDVEGIVFNQELKLPPLAQTNHA